VSAPQGMSVSEQIRCGTGPMYQHMRGIIVEKGRVIEEVRGLLIVHLTYGAESCPIGLYELTFTDQATVRQWWHFEQQKPLLPARAIALVDMDRLLPHERQLFEEQQTTPSVADWLRNCAEASLVQHISMVLYAQDLHADDVTDILFHFFLHEGKPKGDLETYEQTPIMCCKLNFLKRRSLYLWWHRDREEPLTYEQAKALLDMDRLDFGGRQFFDGYVP